MQKIRVELYETADGPLHRFCAYTETEENGVGSGQDETEALWNLAHSIFGCDIDPTEYLNRFDVRR